MAGASEVKVERPNRRQVIPVGVIRAKRNAEGREAFECIRAAERQLEFAEGFLAAAEIGDFDLQEDILDLGRRIKGLRIDSSQLARQIEGGPLI